MNKNTGNKNIKNRPRPNSKTKKGKKKAKKVSYKTLIMFFLFEFVFTACTFPFLLLYGPFENAKSTYVGAAMTSMSHQYLATWFLSDEKIDKILGNNSTQETDETTNASEINIPKVKDDTIEFYELADNPKFTGYYLVVKDPTRVKVGCTSKLNEEGQTTSQIAENYNAIAAVNGGAFVDQSSTSQWTGNGGIPSGIVMSGGEVIHDDLGEGNKTELLAIDKQGVMIVGKYSVEDLKEKGIQEEIGRAHV